MKTPQLRALAECLEMDVYNINLAARHLRQLADYDNLPKRLGKEDVRIVGARYNRGFVPTLNEIKRNTSYGNFIVNHWQRFTKLIGGDMSNKIKIFLLLIYFVGLMVLYLCSVDQYSWVYEMNPSIADGAIENNASDSSVVAFFIFIFLMAIQVFLFVTEQKKNRKMIAVLLACVAVFLFFFRQ